MRHYIAILTYRRLPAFKTMLAGVQEYCPSCRLGVFEDCGNTDDTASFLRQDFSGVQRDDLMAEQYHRTDYFDVFLGTRNLGVAGNSNRAIKVFMDETDCDHLLLCNDDLHVLGDFAAFYGQAHQDLGTKFFAFTDFWHLPTHRWVICRCRGYRVKVFPRMTGIMMSTTRAMIQKVGYFDTRFGKFGEEHSDWTNRIRFLGGIQLDGMDQPCLDVEPTNPDGSAGKPVLRPQDVPTSVIGEERKREDALSVERMREAAIRYATHSHFRPFTLTWPTHVGGLSDTGIRLADIPGYKAVTCS